MNMMSTNQEPPKESIAQSIVTAPAVHTVEKKMSPDPSVNPFPVLRSGPSVGVWSFFEHNLFEEGCIKYGWGKWKWISQVVPGRSSEQCKSHGQKYLKNNPDAKERLMKEHRIFAEKNPNFCSEENKNDAVARKARAYKKKAKKVHTVTKFQFGDLKGGAAVATAGKEKGKNTSPLNGDQDNLYTVVTADSSEGDAGLALLASASSLHPHNSEHADRHIAAIKQQSVHHTAASVAPSVALPAQATVALPALPPLRQVPVAYVPANVNVVRVPQGMVPVHPNTIHMSAPPAQFVRVPAHGLAIQAPGLAIQPNHAAQAYYAAHARAQQAAVHQQQQQLAYMRTNAAREAASRLQQMEQRLDQELQQRQGPPKLH